MKNHTVTVDVDRKQNVVYRDRITFANKPEKAMPTTEEKPQEDLQKCNISNTNHDKNVMERLDKYTTDQDKTKYLEQ